MTIDEHTKDPTGQIDSDEKWIEIIEGWKNSGLTAAEWCREREDFFYQQFIRQRMRLFPDEVRKVDTENTTWSAITMEIPSASIDVFVNHVRIEVNSGFDQDLLREIVEVLKNAN